ncbi:MAG: ATP-binding cassette domain-containing protein [Nitrospirota bacterium]|nr:ATP-binding cassette domain-containing protein [Nitrospirota bacterium]
MRLIARHIRKDYGGRTVLKDCSYEFDAHAVYALMGPNGCGKSTFLRICSLLERPDSGDALFSDGATMLLPDLSLRRRITLVLARTGVFNTTVYRNAAYGLSIRGAGKAEIARKVKEALNFVGLGHKIDQHARTLSSGETQRLGIARALAVEPEILFLDEPTASVDQENTEIIESLIMKMRTDGKTMVIMTTHDRDQADRLADQVLVIRDGSITRH